MNNNTEANKRDPLNNYNNIFQIQVNAKIDDYYNLA